MRLFCCSSNRCCCANQSQVDTLKAAVEYIAQLRDLLNADDVMSPSSSPHDVTRLQPSPNQSSSSIHIPADDIENHTWFHFNDIQLLQQQQQQQLLQQQQQQQLHQHHLIQEQQQQQLSTLRQQLDEPLSLTALLFQREDPQSPIYCTDSPFGGGEVGSALSPCGSTGSAGYGSGYSAQEGGQLTPASLYESYRGKSGVVGGGGIVVEGGAGLGTEFEGGSGAMVFDFAWMN